MKSEISKLISHPGVIAEMNGDRAIGKLFVGLRGFRLIAEPGEDGMRLTLKLYQSKHLTDAQRSYLHHVSRQLDEVVESDDCWFIVCEGEEVSTLIRYARALIGKLNKGLNLLENPDVARAYLAYNPKGKE